MMDIVTDNSAVIAGLNERIAELEKERGELKAHVVALEVDFEKALDIAELCANNQSVVDANKSFQEFVSYTTIESTLEAHNLEQQAKGFDYASNKLTEQQGAAAAPILEMFNYFKNDLLSQAKALKAGT
jgi:hypothetical protein